MKITLIPQRRADKLSLVKNGNKLTINGELFDFTFMSAGDVLPAEAITSDFITGEVRNIGGELHLSMILPLPDNYSQEQAFPTPLEGVPDGEVKLPQPLPTTEEATSA